MVQRKSTPLSLMVLIKSSEACLRKVTAACFCVSGELCNKLDVFMSQ